MNNGWIKLYRKILENPLWCSEEFTKGQAWIDLLMLANFINSKIVVRGVILEVKRGQVGWSGSKLCERWMWSRGKVRRFLDMLETEQQIVQQKNNTCSIITILNYEEYQTNGTADSTANGQQTGQQTDSKRYSKQYTNKELKKEKKKKKEEYIDDLPLFEDKYSFEKVWDLYGKKGNKKTSEGLWNKLPNYKKDLALEKIPLYVRSTPDAQYRKNFEGYLRKECWDDKIITNQCQADLDYEVPDHCKF